MKTTKLLMAGLLALSMTACSGNSKSDSSSSAPDVEEINEDIVTIANSYPGWGVEPEDWKITTIEEGKLKHGEFVEAIANNQIYDDGHPVLIVKAKIKPSYNDDATISQNFFNVEDIIKNQGGDQYEEIQYWAVSDMTDGSESKVISFTLDRNLIDQLAGDLPAAFLNDYFTDANDYWVLPALSGSERADVGYQIWVSPTD